MRPFSRVAFLNVALPSAAFLIMIFLLSLFPALAQSVPPPTLVPTYTPTPPATYSPASDEQLAGTIAIGETVSGTLTFAQPAADYILQAQAGQSISISLTSEMFDTYLSLKDENGQVLAENDDTEGANSKIIGYVLPPAGSYTIVVESFGHHLGSGTQQGSYTLSVTRQEVDHIAYGQTVDDTLTSNHLTRDYVFDGQAGDSVAITLTSSEFSTSVVLLSSDRNELSSSYVTTGSFNSQISPYALPYSLSYIIRVRGAYGGETGAFTLTLNKIETVDVASGTPVQLNLTPALGIGYFHFQGNAGDLITIEAVSGGSLNTSLTLNDPYSNQIAYDDDSGAGLDPEIYQQFLMQTGMYTFVVQAVTPGTGTVTISLARSAPPSLDDGSQTVSFSTSSAGHVLTFTGKARELVYLTLHLTNGRSGAPNVTVYQENANIANASSSGVSDLRFPITVPADGEVTVQIYDYSYSNPIYEIALERSTE